MAGSKLNLAISALVEIYKHGRKGPIGAGEISNATGLSKRYLEQVLGLLAKSGIVTSARGKNGGYELAASPDNIQMSDIWSAVREDITIPLNAGVTVAKAADTSKSKAVASLWEDLHGLVVIADPLDNPAADETLLVLVVDCVLDRRRAAVQGEDAHDQSPGPDLLSPDGGPVFSCHLAPRRAIR